MYDDGVPLQGLPSPRYFYFRRINTYKEKQPSSRPPPDRNRPGCCTHPRRPKLRNFHPTTFITFLSVTSGNTGGQLVPLSRSDPGMRLDDSSHARSSARWSPSKVKSRRGRKGVRREGHRRLLLRSLFGDSFFPFFSAASPHTFVARCVHAALCNAPGVNRGFMQPLPRRVSPTDFAISSWAHP